MDDVTRVSEAVAKVVVFALKGASSGDNADDWLNPTEVSLEHQSHVRSVTSCVFYATAQTHNALPFVKHLHLPLLLVLVCFISRVDATKL